MEQAKLYHVLILESDGKLSNELVEGIIEKTIDIFPNSDFGLAALECNSNIRVAYGDYINDYSDKKWITMEELVKLNKESGLISLFYTSTDKGIRSLDDKQVVAVTNLYNRVRELSDLYEENDIDLLIQKQREHDEKEVFSDADFN